MYKTEKQDKIKFFKRLSLFFIFLSIIEAFLLFFCLLLKNNRFFKTNPQTRPSQSEKTEFPQKNFLTYTRCFGDNRQPDYCELYVSSLKDKKEHFVYKFDFPEVEKDGTQPASEFKINGISKNKVIYTQAYWEKSGEKRSWVRKLGFLDLTTIQDQEICKDFSTSQEGNKQVLKEVFVDQINGSVYYTTQDANGFKFRITQYDLIENKNELLANEQDLKESHYVFGASLDKVFLSTFGSRAGSKSVWAKTLVLESKQILEGDINKKSPVFSGKGDKVAFLKNEEVSEDLYNQYLIVGQPDGGEERIIDSIKNTNVYAYMGPKTILDDYFFNKNGNILSYSRTKFSEKGKPQKQSYISFYELDNKLLSESNLTANVISSDVEYQWVNYLTRTGPFEGKKSQGILYHEDDGWFLKPIYGYYEEEKIDLTDDREVILEGAENVFVVP